MWTTSKLNLMNATTNTVPFKLGKRDLESLGSTVCTFTLCMVRLEASFYRQAKKHVALTIIYCTEVYIFI